MYAEGLIHLDCEEREDGAEEVAQDSVCCDGGGAVGGLVDVYEVGCC